MNTLTEAFDIKAASVTKDRGQAYGHPKSDFARINKIKDAVDICPHAEIRHCLEMIAVKMSRLAETPNHFDSIVDIAGYARCMAMILDKDAEENRIHLGSPWSERLAKAAAEERLAERAEDFNSAEEM